MDLPSPLLGMPHMALSTAAWQVLRMNQLAKETRGAWPFLMRDALQDFQIGEHQYTIKAGTTVQAHGSPFEHPGACRQAVHHHPSGKGIVYCGHEVGFVGRPECHQAECLLRGAARTAQVLIPINHIVRDVREFRANMLEFRPERWLPEGGVVVNNKPISPRNLPKEFMPFGNGPRVCPGNSLAIAEVQVRCGGIQDQCVGASA